MDTLIRRFDTLLRNLHPVIYSTLQPPLSSDALARLETTLGVTLPRDMKSLYQWRNGEAIAGHPPISMMQGRSLLSDRGIITAWTILNECLACGNFPQANWWDPAWIPFMESAGGNLLCVDMRGSFGGHVGQIIEFWHDAFDRTIVHESIAKWLETCVEALGQGHMVLHSDGGLSAPYWHEDRAGWQAYQNLYTRINPGYPIGAQATE